MAKSEAFKNIHGLFKQNLKSCNARAAKETPEDNEKAKIGLISKKQLCTCCTLLLNISLLLLCQTTT